MVVFTKQEKSARPSEYISGINSVLDKMERNPDHENAVELLIEIGELEAGIADFLFRESDSFDVLAQKLRNISMLAGRVLFQSWEGRKTQIPPLIPEIRKGLLSVLASPLPELITSRSPEGYVFYGLFPEMYIEAAKLFYLEKKPAKAVCIGLRSIGTSLSAAVGGSLFEMGARVESFTLRPRGHPFRRKALLSPDLEEKLSSLSESSFLIIDEGPGLSGSSFGSAAQALSDLGIPDRNIILFPSHVPDSSRFIKSQASARWSDFRKFVVPFEEKYLSGKLLDSFDCGRIMEISAGTWRGSFFQSELDYPPLHPNHEQRKYLCMEESPDKEGVLSGPVRMIKFVGFGKYGRARYERAVKLSGLGLYPEVNGLRNGFLIRHFVPGAPVSENEVGQDLLNFAAQYLARTGMDFQVPGGIPFESNMRMIMENTMETLGPEWAGYAEKLSSFYSVLKDYPLVAIDGRVMRHEWVKTPKGFFKADSISHHMDQFYPRNQDTAWDVAGLCVEFPLRGAGREFFLDRYEALSGDKNIKKKLPFYLIAYLAFRLGYAELASMDLGNSPDGLRLKTLRDYYSFQLKMELSRLNAM